MSGCSILTQGYVDSKPQIEKLEVQKSTKKDVIDLLGEPAIYSINLNCIYRSIRTAMPEFNRTLLQ